LHTERDRSHLATIYLTIAAESLNDLEGYVLTGYVKKKPIVWATST
jgi:hypothetical protein